MFRKKKLHTHLRLTNWLFAMDVMYMYIQDKLMHFTRDKYAVES